MKELYALFFLVILIFQVRAQTTSWNVSNSGSENNPASKLQILGIPDNVLTDTILVSGLFIIPNRDTVLDLTALGLDANSSHTFLYKRGNSQISTYKIEQIAVNQVRVDTIRSIFYDALWLTQAEKKDSVAVTQILAHYVPDLNIGANHFLKSLDGIRANSSHLIEASAETQSLLASGSSGRGLGGLDVTKYADGLARFLVTRAKEELTITFFSELKDKIISNPDIKDLFHHTALVLDKIDQDIYQFQKYIQVLRQNFYLDIKQLPKNFPKVIGNYPTFFSHHPALENLITISTDIWVGIANEEHPGDILSGITVKDSLEKLGNLGGGLKLAQLVSESIQTKDMGGRYWIADSNLASFSDTLFFKYFMGLSIEVAKAREIKIIEDKGKVDVYNVLNDSHEVIMAHQEQFARIYHKTAMLTRSIQPIIKKQKEEKALVADEIIQYAEVIADLFALGQDMMATLSDLEVLTLPLDLVDKLDRYVGVTQSVAYFLGDLSAEEYTAAVFQFINIYEAIITNPDNNKIDLEKRKGLEILKKHIFFLAQMADAETSEKVEKVITNYALPSQSYRHKREVNFNISLNAYLGVSYNSTESDHLVSLTAPVGIGLNWGFGTNSLISSFSIYGNFIDVGAISAFRFQEDETQIAKVYLREIFSPGIHLSFGVHDWPLAINVGYQAMPLLKTVGESENDVRINRVGSFSTSLVIDIPILNLYK